MPLHIVLFILPNYIQMGLVAIGFHALTKEVEAVVLITGAQGILGNGAGESNRPKFYEVDAPDIRGPEVDMKFTSSGTSDPLSERSLTPVAALLYDESESPGDRHFPKYLHAAESCGRRAMDEIIPGRCMQICNAWDGSNTWHDHHSHEKQNQSTVEYCGVYMNDTAVSAYKLSDIGIVRF